MKLMVIPASGDSEVNFAIDIVLLGSVLTGVPFCCQGCLYLPR